MPVTEARYLAKAAMESAFEHLANRVCLFLESQAQTENYKTASIGPKEPSMNSLVLGGGVASNNYLKHILRSYLDVRGFGHLKLEFSPPALCVDNAAMIAWTAAEMTGITTAGPEFELNAEELRSSLSMRAIRRWSLENLMAPERELERELEEEKERDERRQRKAPELETSAHQAEASDPSQNMAPPTSSDDLSRLLASFQARPESIPLRPSTEPGNDSNASQTAPDSASIEATSSVRMVPPADSRLTRKQAAAKYFGTDMQGEGVLQIDPARGLSAQLQHVVRACTSIHELKDQYWKTVRWVDEQMTQDRLRTCSERKRLAEQHQPGRILRPAFRNTARKLRMDRLYVAELFFILRYKELRRASTPTIYPIHSDKLSVESVMSYTPIIRSVQRHNPISVRANRTHMRARRLHRTGQQRHESGDAIEELSDIWRRQITSEDRVAWPDSTQAVGWAPISGVGDEEDDRVSMEPSSKPSSTEDASKPRDQSSSTVDEFKQPSEQSKFDDDPVRPHQLKKMSRLKDSKGWDLGPLGSEI